MGKKGGSASAGMSGGEAAEKAGREIDESLFTSSSQTSQVQIMNVLHRRLLVIWVEGVALYSVHVVITSPTLLPPDSGEYEFHFQFANDLQLHPISGLEWFAKAVRLFTCAREYLTISIGD